MRERSPRPLRFVRIGGLFAALLSTVLAAGSASAAPPSADRVREVEDATTQLDNEIQRPDKIKAAILRLESKSQRNPDALTLYLLARAYGKDNRGNDAVEAFGEVLKADPAFVWAFRDRAIVHYVGGKSLLQQVAKNPNASPETVRRATEAANKSYADAEADLEAALAIWPDYPDALQNFAILLLEMKRPKEAIPYLRRLLDREPTRAGAHEQLLLAYEDAKQFDDALRLLEPMIAASPNDWQLRLRKGALLAEKGSTAEALAIFKQIATENPTARAPLDFWLLTARKAGNVSRDDAIWILERRLRLATTEEERQAIQKQIEELSRPKTAPTGPPKAADLAAAIRGPDPAVRKDVLEHLAWAKFGGWTEDLVAAVIERLDPTVETDPHNRTSALIIFERFQQPTEATLGLFFASAIRASLRDPDPEVRAMAASVLGTLDSPAALPFLAPVATGNDLALAVAARSSAYQLARMRPPETGEDPKAQADAFTAWWTSDAATPVKLRAIDDAKQAKDPAPEEVLIRLAIDKKHVEVSMAAIKALGEIAGREAPPKRKAWLQTFPKLQPADLEPGHQDATLSAVLDWWDRRPK